MKKQRRKPVRTVKSGYYEEDEGNINLDTKKLDTYSEDKDDTKSHIGRMEERTLKSQQEDYGKGISLGNVAQEPAMEQTFASAEVQGAASAEIPPASAESVALKIGMKALEEVKKFIKRPESSPEDKQFSGTVKTAISISATLLVFYLAFFPITLFPMLSSISTVLIFSNQQEESQTKIVQYPHIWIPVSRDNICQQCDGNGVVSGREHTDTVCSMCKGSTVIICQTCKGEGFTYTVRNSSGVADVDFTEYEYKSYRTETGCPDCGGSGMQTAYYESIMGGGERLAVEDTNKDFLPGTGSTDCGICNATGYYGNCLLCNGQGVNYYCMNPECPYSEWNNWESLGVDIFGVCYEKEVEVTEE